MSVFSRIDHYILFFLIISLLIPQSSKAATLSKDKSDSLFELLPVINTLLKSSSNQVPPRGTVVAPTPFQLEQLKRYYKLSISSYCGSVTVQNRWNCKFCLESVPDGKLISTFSDFIYDVSGFVLRSDKEEIIYVVFRGSASIINAIWDLAFSYENYPRVNGAYVHKGFYSSYKGIRNSFKPILKRVKSEYPSYDVVFTGHSFGGALSMYAAVDLFESDPIHFNSGNMAVYTYGSPRVGNEAFAKYVADTGIFVSRTVHQADSIAQSPKVSQGYLHVGIESLIYADPDFIRICTSKLESSLCGIPFDVENPFDHLNYFGIVSTCSD